MHGEPTSIHMNGRVLDVGLTVVRGGRLRLWMEPGDAPREGATVKLRAGTLGESWYEVASVLRMVDPAFTLAELAPIPAPGKRVLPKPEQPRMDSRAAFGS